MQDRDVFMDVLAGTKHSINCYTNAIMETSNQQLRSTWQTLRNEAEQLQYQIYQMAEQKGYYIPAPPANPQDIQKVKSTLTSAVNNMNNSGSQGSNIYSGGTVNPTLHVNTDTTPSMVSSTNQNMTNSFNQNQLNNTNNMKLKK
jgi:hypothetical protein